MECQGQSAVNKALNKVHSPDLRRMQFTLYGQAIAPLLCVVSAPPAAGPSSGPIPWPWCRHCRSPAAGPTRPCRPQSRPAHKAAHSVYKQTESRKRKDEPCFPKALLTDFVSLTNSAVQKTKSAWAQGCGADVFDLDWETGKDSNAVL
jgi:hypothetical protein